MTRTVYDETEVRLAVLRACDEVGGQAEFARRHNMDPHDLSRMIRGEKTIGIKVPAIIGFEKVIGYVRKAGITSDTKPQTQTIVFP
jgi:hypothetical protein